MESGVKRFSVLFVMSVFFGLNSYFWAIASPIGSGIDDDFHLPSVWCANGDQKDVCETVIKGDGFVKVPAPLVNAPLCISYQNYKSANCIYEILAEDNAFEVGRANELKRFPDGYYKIHNLLVSNNVESSIINMRLLNSIIFLCCVLLGFYITNWAFKWNFVLITFLLATPFALSIIVSNNPSSWLISSMVLLTASLFSLLNESKKSKVLVSLLLIVFCFILSFSSRSEGPIYLAIVSIIFCIIFIKKIHTAAKLSIILLCALSAYSTINQPSTLGISTGLSSTGVPEDPSVWLFSVISEFPRFFYGVFGSWGFGWMDFEVPISVYFFFILFFVGLIFSNLPKIQSRILMFSALNLFAITLLILRVMYLSSNVVGVNIQPRYLLPFLFPVVGSLLVYIPNLINRNMMIFLTFIIFSGISYLFSFHIWIQHFTAGSNNFALNLNSNFEWWWNSLLLPTPLWILSTLIYISILLFCILGNTTTSAPPLPLHAKNKSQY
jgi:hypothetical protein